ASPCSPPRKLTSPSACTPGRPRTRATPGLSDTTRPPTLAPSCARPLAASACPTATSARRAEPRRDARGRSRSGACSVLSGRCILVGALFQRLEEPRLHVLEVRVEVPGEAIRMGAQLDAAGELRHGAEAQREV